MFEFKWRESYSVKHEIIDKQHKKLFELLNNLNKYVNLGSSTSKISIGLKSFADQAEDHFNSEEDIMRSIEFDGLRDHFDEHRNFEENLKKIILECEKDINFLTETMVESLQYWLIDHIIREDKAYALLLRGSYD